MTRIPYPHRLQPLAARISKACQLAHRAGFVIVDGTYGSPEKRCLCPVGALYWVEGTALGAAARFKGEDEFVAGFDGIDRNEDEGATGTYELGREFRRRFIRKSPL